MASGITSRANKVTPKGQKKSANFLKTTGRDSFPTLSGKDSDNYFRAKSWDYN